MGAQTRIQQQFDTYLAAIDMLSAITDVVKNPDSIKQTIKLLIEGNTIAEEKKKEVEEAEASIVLSRELLSKIEIERNEHASRVASEIADIEKQRSDIEAALADLVSTKQITKDDLDKYISEEKEKLSAAENELIERQSKLIEREEKFRVAMA